VVPLVGARTVAVRTNAYHSDAGVTTPGDLLLVDVATGAVQGRIALPPQAVGKTVPQSGGVAFMAVEGREPLSGLAEGIALAHTAPLDSQPSAETVVGLEFVDAAGHRSEVMAVDGSIARILVRGSVR